MHRTNAHLCLRHLLVNLHVPAYAECCVHFRSSLSCFQLKPTPIANTCAVNPVYCTKTPTKSTNPGLNNANEPTAQTSLDSTTTFTCNPGYSDNTATYVAPYYKCQAGNNWSPITGDCNSTLTHWPRKTELLCT